MTTDVCVFSSCSSTSTPPAVVQRQETIWKEHNPVVPRARQHSILLCRRSSFRYLYLVQQWTVTFLCCLSLLSLGTHAHRVLANDLISGELLFDGRAPIPLMQARNEASALASTTIRPSSSTTATGGVQLASEISTTLPRPFDSNIGNNFTTSTCPTYFDRFLSNQTFVNCLPLSLLLQTSNSFFTASRSLVRLTTTLDATCNIDFAQCSSLMAGLAQNIKQNSNCGSDLAMGNPTVVQAYNGFVAYDTLYHAGCLNDASGGYCYANAVTNTSAPTSSYIYYLPLGVQLPGGSRPACTTCLQNTMAIFAQAAGNSSLPLNEDYGPAAEQVQMSCGPSFVQASVQVSLSAPRISVVSGSLGCTIVFLVLGMSFVA